MNVDLASGPAVSAGHGDPSSTPVVPVLQETVGVEWRQVETGLVRVQFDPIVAQPPSFREEGDAPIIPVVEEIPVVEKRFRLKEDARHAQPQRTIHETASGRTEAVTVEQTPQPPLP